MISRSAIIKIAATAAFLLLCALLPSWFTPVHAPGVFESTPPIETAAEPLESFSARAELFNASFVGNEIKGREFDPEELDEAAQQACSDLLTYILDTLTIDQYPENKDLHAGFDFKTISGNDGSFVRLVRYFRGWDGDWKNWIDIIIDADTQDIYYIYISSSCLQNHGQYKEIPSNDSLLRFMNELLGQEATVLGVAAVGIDVKLSCAFEASEDGQRYATAYDIIGHNYFDDYAPSRLFDYKIICATDATLIQQSVEFDAKT